MKRYIKQIVVYLIVFLLGLNIFNFRKVNASTFSDATYKSAMEYTELETRIVSESSKQAIEFFQMVSRWEVYGASEQEQYDGLKEYISKTKERYSFVNNYNSLLANEVKNSFNLYTNLMEEELTKSISNFLNGPVVFIDFLEKNISNTQGNYLSFKKDGLNKFLDTFIYTNDNKIAINKIANGSTSDKEEGKETLKRTISALEDVKTKQIEQRDQNGNIIKVYVSPEVIRNYAQAYQDYYRQVLNGDFSKSSEFLLHEQYRIEGLLPVGVVYDEISEFNLYKNIFNQFTDYPTYEIALDLNSKKIKKTLSTLNKQDVKTSNIQELKKLHYEFLYQLSDYKKTKNKDAVLKAYNDFYDHYFYLNSYYSRVTKRFGNFSSLLVLEQLSKTKEKSKCIDVNFEGINNLNYNPNFTTDTNSYREFLISKDFNNYLLIGGITILGLGLISFIIIKKNKKSNNFYDDDYEYYDNNW